ncbi:MAG: cupin domain-containing protein [Stackebrandtia sp.]
MSTRRIVTAQRDGDSRIVSAGPSPHVVEPAPGFVITDQWVCPKVGPGLLTAEDHGEFGFMVVPPPGGVLFRLVTFPPDPVGQLHRTDTIDFVTVLSGELVLTLDGGDEVTLTAGDTVVQQGALHAWRNLTGEPAVASVVIVSAA